MNFRNSIFRYRGWLFIPSGIVMLTLSKPTLPSLVLGLFVSLFIGEGIRIWAVRFSGETTRDKDVKAENLITAGPYAHMRNPLYLGNMISWLGFSLAACGATPFWATGVILLTVFLSFAVIYGNIVPLEEDYLHHNFGDSYAIYKNSVPRWIPRLVPYGNQEGVSRPQVIINAEMHTILMLVGVIGILVLKYRLLSLF